ncbi:MAG: carbon storage regulator [Rhodopirellula sp.]|nr:carbon storage regulator [Rhodopirellula sp.]
MLIFLRKRDEQIVIGDGIVVTVVSIRSGRVRIGVEAPANTSICRQESVRASEAIESGRSAIDGSSGSGATEGSPP